MASSVCRERVAFHTPKIWTLVPLIAHVLLYLLMGFFVCILLEIIHIKFIFIFVKRMFTVPVYTFMTKMYLCFDASLGIFVLHDRIIKTRKSMPKICKINNEIWHIEVSTPKRFVVLLFNAYNYIYSIQNTLAAVINYIEAIIKQTKQCIIYQNS